jgi:hypothetical protein
MAVSQSFARVSIWVEWAFDISVRVYAQHRSILSGQTPTFVTDIANAPLWTSLLLHTLGSILRRVVETEFGGWIYGI